MGILSQQKKQSSKNRVEHIARTPLIGVDEAHNYLNKNSNRTKKLKEHNADVTLLATATPINTGFSDLIRELEILGIGLYDPDLKKELWRLENDINSKNQDVRLGARKRARELIQPYMVRRTRTEIKDIAIQHQEKYLDEEGRNCNFPEYDITLVESDIIPKIGVGESTLPQIANFFQKIGIQEEDWMEKANAVRKLGNIKRLSLIHI